MNRVFAALIVGWVLSCSTGCFTPTGGAPGWSLPNYWSSQKQAVPQATIPKLNRAPSQQPAQQNKPSEDAYSTRISD